MKCHRCGGKLVYEKFCANQGQFYGWRCIFCGEIIDKVILENRHDWKRQYALFEGVTEWIL
jgi:hypothetical protein